MTLRWIIGSIGFLVIVLFGLAAFLLQENLVLYFLNPKTPYETYTPPPAPDYVEDSSWAHIPPPRPDGSEDENGQPVTERPAIFYVHSTTYNSREHWNGPIDDSQSRELTLRTSLANEAGPFASLGDVYAPFYRQATLFAFFTQKHQGRESRKTAYSDVARAFENFLQRVEPERPVVLVGYDQGGLHVQRLLIDYFQTDELLRRRLAAAYVINQAMPLDLFSYALANLAPCETADDVRCVVSWTAYSKHFEREMWRTRERALIWDADGDLRAAEGRDLLCTNPLSWRIGDTVADPDAHLGAASASGMPFGEQPVVVEDAVSVRCENGIAVVSIPGKGWLKRPRWFGRQWAPLNFNLFYEDIQRNVEMRLTALSEIRATEGIPAPPMGTATDIEDSPVNQVPDIN